MATVRKSRRVAPREKVIKGEKITPSRGAESFYRVNLCELVNEVDKSVKRVIKLKKGNEFTNADIDKLSNAQKRIKAVAKKVAKPVAEEFIKRTHRATVANFKMSTKGLQDRIEENQKDELTKAIRKGASRKAIENVQRKSKKSTSVTALNDDVAENIRIINELPNEHFEKAKSIIRKSIRQNVKRQETIERLKKLGRSAKERAKRISKGETRRVTEKVVLEECKRVGIEKVMWRHSNLSKVPREYHLAQWDGRSGKKNGKPNGLNGFIFDINNPPVIDKKTCQRGYPGDLYGCKCFLLPIIVEEKIKKHLTRKK